MKILYFILFALLAGALQGKGPKIVAWTERQDWGVFFEKENTEGTIVVHSDKSNTTHVYNPDRAKQRFIPASTFKIPHTLFVLDAGIIRDEQQVIPWNGVKYGISGWNKDQTLQTAMQNSTVWVYQRFAAKLGTEREEQYLQKIKYGNMDPSGNLKRFWLDGKLAISAVEQIQFLKQLNAESLPFERKYQKMVKRLIKSEEGEDWVIRAKTGWAVKKGPDLGWWVGWVETPKDTTYFALNISMPNGLKDAPNRQRIVKEILQDQKMLP